MPATAYEDRDPSTCDLLALPPPPEVCAMAVRMLALHHAATELAIATLAAVLATASSSDAAGADPPTVTMETPSTWREDQEKARKYALRRRKRREKRLRAARAPVVDPSPKGAKKNCATSKKPRRAQKTPRPAPMSQPVAPALAELVARKGLSRKEKKIAASFAANVSSLRPRLASLRDPEHRHQKPLPLSRLRRNGDAP